MLEGYYQIGRLQSMTCTVTCGHCSKKTVACQSNVRVIAPRSYSSSSPLCEARDSFRVHGQWRLEVLAPARCMLRPAAPEARSRPAYPIRVCVAGDAEQSVRSETEYLHSIQSGLPESAHGSPELVKHALFSQR